MVDKISAAAAPQRPVLICTKPLILLVPTLTLSKAAECRAIVLPTPTIASFGDVAPPAHRSPPWADRPGVALTLEGLTKAIA
jgi:hypothetical protein